MTIKEQPPDYVPKLVDEFVERSGIRNVASGRLIVDDEFHNDRVVFTAAFDPWYWTGRRD